MCRVITNEQPQLLSELRGLAVAPRYNAPSEGDRQRKPARPQAHCSRAEWRRYLQADYAWRESVHDGFDR